MMLLNSHKKRTIRDVRLHIFIGHQQSNFHRFSKPLYTFLNKLCSFLVKESRRVCWQQRDFIAKIQKFEKNLGGYLSALIG